MVPLSDGSKGGTCGWELADVMVVIVSKQGADPPRLESKSTKHCAQLEKILQDRINNRERQTADTRKQACSDSVKYTPQRLRMVG